MNRWSLVGLYASKLNKPFIHYLDYDNEKEAQAAYFTIKDSREWFYLEVYYGSRDIKIPELNFMKLLF